MNLRFLSSASDAIFLKTANIVLAELKRMSRTRIEVACVMALIGFFFFASNAHAQDTTLSTSNLKSLSLEELMNIEVTSVSKVPEKLSDAASAIQVITNDDIHRSGAANIPEALQLADNLDVAQGSSAGWNISARGFNASVGDKLLVLIDGRSVYTPLFSGVIWNAQDYLMEDIDRVEVISGPGGTLWGANAVNGVINITTKSSKDAQGWYAEASRGSDLEGSGALRYGGTLAPDVYYRAYGKYFNDGPGVYNNGTNAADAWDRAQGGFRIDDDHSADDKLTLQGDIYHGTSHVSDSSAGDAGGGNVLGRWTHTVSSSNEYSLQMYFDRTHLDDPFPSSLNLPAGTLGDNLNTYDVDFQDRLHLGMSTQIVWGMESRFTHDVVTDAPSVGFVPNILNQTLLSAFLQEDIKLSDNLTETIGCKVEHNDYTGYELEPNGRLRYALSETQMLWGAISRAVRAPSRYDRDLNQPSTGYTYPYYLVANPDFQSETVVSYELGYRAEFSNRLSGSISVFYNTYDSLRSLGYRVVPPATLDVLYENFDHADTRGIEISSDLQVCDDWRLHAGFDVLREHVYVDPGEIDLYAGYNETADPNRQLFLRSSLNAFRDVEFDVDFRGIDALRINSGSVIGSVPGYFEANSRIGWHLSRMFELSAVGQNLLHAHHAEYGFPTPMREEIPRSGFAEIVWQM
jgi:iron complex outermembrane receptor protein